VGGGPGPYDARVSPIATEPPTLDGLCLGPPPAVVTSVAHGTTGASTPDRSPVA